MQGLVAGMLNISDQEFKLIAGLVYEKFGITLSEHKKELVRGRLNKIVKDRGFKNFQEFYHAIGLDKTGELLSILIDKISTNHTYFFREKDHFEFLRDKIFPEWMRRIRLFQTHSFRIWSAGCSSGEEVYTLAMLINDFFQEELHSIDLGILATDISLTVLQQAKEGIYSAERIKEVPPALKQRYFNQLSPDLFEVKENLKSMVLFKRLNLMREIFPFKGKFDAIFCRNVMIYFDTPTKEALTQRLKDNLKPGGYLFIGHSESLNRNKCGLTYIRPAIYRNG